MLFLLAFMWNFALLYMGIGEFGLDAWLRFLFLSLQMVAVAVPLEAFLLYHMHCITAWLARRLRRTLSFLWGKTQGK